MPFATRHHLRRGLPRLLGIAHRVAAFDNLSKRPHGNLRTTDYSVVLMLWPFSSAARLVFRREVNLVLRVSRTWTVMVMPPLIAALAPDLTRSAVGGLVFRRPWF